MSSTRVFASVLVACVLVAGGGCGDDGGMTTPDSGVVLPDGGPPAPDAGEPGLGTCESPVEVDGVIGTVTVDGDTTDGPDGPLDLGGCGNFEAPTRAPQAVIAYTVPGTGPRGITFTTATGETLTNFDTVVQVRRDCGAIPEGMFPPSCFDEISATDPRSEGALPAMGGETLYFIVTGFTDTPTMDAIDEGPFTLEITARENVVPTITGGEVRLIGDRTEVEASGEDADRDGLGVMFTFYDADGNSLDVDGDGTADDSFVTGFDAPVTGALSWTGIRTILAFRFGDSARLLSERLIEIGAAEARLRVFDEVFALSEELTVPLRMMDEVGLGAACGETAACYSGLRCVSGTCQPTAGVAAACEAAPTLEIATPTDTTTSARQTGSLTSGDGLFEASCGHTPGTERLFSVTVPAGSFDLVATTDLDGTGETDTVLYVRGECADLSTELEDGCNDDIVAGGANIRSRVELRNIAEGTYTVYVESFGHVREGPVPFELEVALRPVISTGATCDPRMVENRCSTGACSPSTHTCP